MCGLIVMARGGMEGGGGGGGGGGRRKRIKIWVHSDKLKKFSCISSYYVGQM